MEKMSSTCFENDNKPGKGTIFICLALTANAATFFSKFTFVSHENKTELQFARGKFEIYFKPRKNLSFLRRMQTETKIRRLYSSVQN